ncbi:MAG: hypothetical protein JKY65_17345 [Planctomycetes bacterium]|nr:hypothetical protein [Planctomycetota bacterium]
MSTSTQSKRTHWASLGTVLLACLIAISFADVTSAQGRRKGKRDKKRGSKRSKKAPRATIILDRGRELENVEIREEKWAAIKYRAKGTRRVEEVRGEKVLEIRYVDADPVYSSGVSRVRAGLYKRAVESFDKVLGALEDDNSWTWFYSTYWRGEAKRLSGDAKGAASDLKALTDKDPEHFLAPRAFFALGLAHGALKSASEAEAAFTKLDQGFGQVWAAKAQLGLGDAYLMMGKLLEARRAYGLAGSRSQGDPNLRLGAQVGEAKCMVMRKEFDGALKTFASILRQKGISPAVMAAAYAGKGDCLRAQGESTSNNETLKKALLAFQTVVVRFAGVPESYPRSLFRSAELYAKLGLEKLAELQRKELRSRCPSSPWTAKLP